MLFVSQEPMNLLGMKNMTWIEEKPERKVINLICDQFKQ